MSWLLMPFCSVSTVVTKHDGRFVTESLWERKTIYLFIYLFIHSFIHSFHTLAKGTSH